PAAPAGPQGGADRPLVLVVEDNPDMNAFVRQVLLPRFRVAAAFDGAEGLAEARRLRPDLIVADVMMPVVSGAQMVRELREIEALSRELETARDQAVRALRLREEFISIASHELRTPLTSLKLVAQLALRKEGSAALLEKLGAQVQRLTRLVEEMLDFSRVQ